jgi:hypothetical protein
MNVPVTVAVPFPQKRDRRSWRRKAVGCVHYRRETRVEHGKNGTDTHLGYARSVNPTPKPIPRPASLPRRYGGGLMVIILDPEAEPFSLSLGLIRCMVCMYLLGYTYGKVLMYSVYF